MGVFKEREIEQMDFVLRDIQGIQNSFRATDENWDGYSLFLPHYDEEVGGLLPHEQSSVPASWVFDLIK